MTNAKSFFCSWGPAFGLMIFLALPSQASLVDLWEFEDGGDLTKATFGADLTLTGSDLAVAGSGGPDAGASQLGVGDFYTATHGIGANGGGSLVNEWTLVLDVSYPTASAGSWMTFFQTNQANSNDGDAFIKNSNPTGAIGVAATGYSTNTTAADAWYRVVFSVDNGTSYKTFVNGVEWIDSGSQDVDGRFSLDPTLLLFADNDGDDATINVSNAALFNTALTPDQVTALGGAGRQIVPEPTAIALALLSSAGLLGWHRGRAANRS